MHLSRFRNRIDFFLRNVSAPPRLSKQPTVLVVGCGGGEEALCIQRMCLGANVVGIDIKLPAKETCIDNIHFALANALNLPFRDDSVDFCYCYHVLEHVPDHSTCVAEMARVLKTDGELYLSTPNSKRLLLYVLSAQKEALSTIVRRNLREWIARLTGRFSNERGYHNGFAYADLFSVLATNFKEVRFVTDEYTLRMATGSIYLPFAKFLSWIHALKTVAPSHTVYCKRSRGTQARGR